MGVSFIGVRDAMKNKQYNLLNVPKKKRIFANHMANMIKNIDKLIVVGDRVLIKINDAADHTKSGLYLPAGYQDKEAVQSGYILKCGPGYPLPNMDNDEPWNHKDNDARYLPLQVQPGDLALFLQKNAIEIKYDGEKYFIVPQSAILLIERDEF